MQKKSLSPGLKGILIIIFGLGFCLLAMVGFLITYHITYADRIYPGVRVGWIDVSSLTVDEATALLSTEYIYPQQGQIILRDWDRSWLISPAQIGLFFEPGHTAQAAFGVGRNGPVVVRLLNQFNAWYTGVVLPVNMLFDEQIAQRYLEGIAAEIDSPTVEASLSVDGTEVIVHPGQVGRIMDVAATQALIEARLKMLIDSEIQVVVEESPPIIMDVTEQAEIAERILSESLVLYLPDSNEGNPGPWIFEPDELARMLVIERVAIAEGETYQVGLSYQLLRGFLESIAPSLRIERANARFIFNDDTRNLEVIQPSITGQFLDIDTSLKLIQEQVVAGEHDITLDLEYILPEVASEATAESLGITELVSSHTSYFYGSDSSRKLNIATAASRFHGVLVAPGETFSMADVLGSVSLDEGYAEAWIIYGGRTIKGVGGGVCQVSTTLFRTVFFSGYPILERYPHAYRVYYYEQTYGGGTNSKWAGLDATVFVPVVDFKFKNDSENWLLMETYVGDYYLNWKFYSTSDGRSVEWETTGLMNIQDPPDPLYQENDAFAKGEIKQVDWAVKGADVTVTRYVYLNGEIINTDIFTTHYMPWRAVCEYGPGTPGMPPENPNENEPCKPD